MKKTFFAILYILFVGSLITLLILPSPEKPDQNPKTEVITPPLKKVSTSATLKLSPFTLSFPRFEEKYRLEPLSIPTELTYQNSLKKRSVSKEKQCKIHGPKERAFIEKNNGTLLLIWQKELDGKQQQDTTSLRLLANNKSINGEILGTILEKQFFDEVQKLSEREIEKRNFIAQNCTIEKKSINVPTNIVTISTKEIRISFLDNTKIDISFTHEIL